METEILIKEDEKDMSTFGLMFTSILIGSVGILNFLLAMSIIEALIAKEYIGSLIILILTGLIFWFGVRRLYRMLRSYYTYVQSQVNIALEASSS